MGGSPWEPNLYRGSEASKAAVIVVKKRVQGADAVWERRRCAAFHLEEYSKKSGQWGWRPFRSVDHGKA